MKLLIEPFVIYLVYIPSIYALKCYICNSAQNSDCHDLEKNIRSQECMGDLKWGERFACLKNTSLRNNLIETDRMCVIVDGKHDACDGKKHPNRFGDCFVCQSDDCNGERLSNINNGSLITKSNLMMIIILIIHYKLFLHHVSLYHVIN